MSTILFTVDPSSPILKLGADHTTLLSYQSPEGDNILLYALKKDCRKTLKFLSSYPFLMAQLMSDKSKSSLAIRDAICRGSLDIIFEYLHLSEFDLMQFNEPDETLLQHCAAKGYLNGLKELLTLSSQHIFLEKPDSKGFTPIIHAILSGHQNLEIATMLLKAGSSVASLKNFRTAEKNESILALAAKTSSTEMLDFLLKIEGIQELLAVQNSNKNTPVLIAALSGKIENMKLLLQYRVSIDSLLSYRYNTNNTILDYAVSKENMELITCIREATQKQIASLISIHSSTNSRSTLFLAITKDNPEILKMLFDMKTLLNFRSEKGETTILHIVVGNKAHNLLIFFLGLKEFWNLFEIKDSKGNTPLVQAAFWGDAECIDKMIKYGADYKVLSEWRFQSATLLMAVAPTIRSQSLKYLLSLPELRSQLEMRDYKGRTAICFAAVNGNSEALQCFLEAGASPQILAEWTDEKKSTLLTIIASTRKPDSANKEVVKTLEILFKDPSFAVLINLQDVEKRTALLHAALKGNAAVFNFLLQKNAETENLLNYQDYNGNNILQVLINVRHLNILEIFLDHPQCKLWATQNARLQHAFNTLMKRQSFSATDTDIVMCLTKFGASIHDLYFSSTEMLNHGTVLTKKFLSNDDAATRKSHLEYMNWLLSFEAAKALLDVPNKDKHYPLTNALYLYSFEEVELLIKAGARTSMLSTIRYPMDLWGLKITPDIFEGILLFNTIDKVKKLEWLIKLPEMRSIIIPTDMQKWLMLYLQKFPVPAISDVPSRPLNEIIAEFRGVINFLCENGASLTAALSLRDPEDNTLLTRFLKSDISITRERMVILLSLPGIEKLINVCNRNSETPILLALKHEHYATIPELISKGAKFPSDIFQKQNSDGNTVLQLAIVKNLTEFAKYLIVLPYHKTFIDNKNSLGATALLLAFLNGNVEIVRGLLAANASTKELVEYRDDSQKNILQVLATKEFSEEVQLELTKLSLHRLMLDENALKLAFRDAIYYGRSGIFQALYAYNPRLGDNLQNWRDEDGNSVLMFSVIKNHKMLPCLFEPKLVCENGKSLGDNLLNVTNNAGRTPLVEAIIRGYDYVVSYLLQHGARTTELFSYQEKGENLLMLCIRKRFIPASLLSIPNFDALLKAVLEFRFDNGNTVLHDIISDKTMADVEFIKRLLYLCSDLRQLLAVQNKNKETPLLLAVLKDKVETIKVLLQYRRNAGELIDFRFEYGGILAYVTYQGSFEMLQLLLSLKIGNRYLKDITNASVTIWNKSKYTSESIAVLRGDQRIADLFGIKLLEWVDKSDAFGSGNSVLNEAAMVGFKLGIENLLKIPEFKAKIRTPDAEGHTPVIKAIMHGHKEVILLLQANGSESFEELATFRDLKGNTLLNLAIQSNRNSEAAVAELLTNPLFQKQINDPAVQPLVDAALKRNHKIFRWLLEAGANIENIALEKFKVYFLTDDFAKNVHSAMNIMRLSRTTIPKSEMTAKIHDYVNCLKAGASPQQRDAEGNTPLHLVAAAGNYFLIDILLLYKTNLFSKNNAGETPVQLAERGSSINKFATVASLYIAMTEDVLSRAIISSSASDYIQTAFEAACQISDPDEQGGMILACIQKISDYKEIFQHFKREDVIRAILLIKEGSQFFKKAQFELARIYFDGYKSKAKQNTLFPEDSDSEECVSLQP